MIRQLSLVCKRPELPSEEFLARSPGEHVEIAKRLPGLRGSAATGARVGA